MVEAQLHTKKYIPLCIYIPIWVKYGLQWIININTAHPFLGYLADKVGVDMLGLMMLARDENSGEGMTDKELRDQVMTVMLAGHEVGH